MNRCINTATPYPALTRRFASFALATALLGAATTSWAQFGPRQFPASAQRGTLQVLQPPEVLLNDKPARLSPGARIRGANNMLLMSGAIVGQSLLVNYVRDPLGLVHEVWVLTEAEARLPVPAGTPAP